MQWKQKAGIMVGVALLLELAFIAYTFISLRELATASFSYLDEYVAPEVARHPLPEPVSIEDQIREYAILHNFDPDVAVRIAMCESSLDPMAKNADSSAVGLYQFTRGTWDWIEATGDPSVPSDAIREFIKWYPKHPGWWVCK